MMSDPRFAPDTLFLVAEEDWRLWKADCKKGAPLKPGEFPKDREAELSAPSGSGDAYPVVEAFQDPGQSSSQPTKDGLRTFGRGTKAKPADVQQTSQELLDILHMCNTAHRHGKGDVVWLSYVVNTKQRWCPCHGSTLIAVSARGGRILKENWSKWFKKPYHFDVALKEVLQELSAGNTLPACYVFPSVGGYDEHISAFMNVKKAQVRECHWEQYNAIQEGTREVNSSTGRAFSRSLPWQKYKLKEFPLEQRYREKFEVTILDEIPTLPLSKPDIWWTAAATIDPSYYELSADAPVQWDQVFRNKFSSYQPSKRPGSPTRQLAWEWDGLKGSTTKQHESIDDSEVDKIKISFEQLWSPLEKSEFKTQSSGRRMRNVIANFERRYFTNDPEKVGTHSGKFLMSAKTYDFSDIYFLLKWAGF